MDASEKKPFVLIIEDEHDHRENLREILEKDYTLAIARTGKEALALFEKHYINLDLILLDICLEDMSGYEIYAGMEAIALGGIPNIIAVTAYSETENMIEVMTKAHAYYHVSKPFSA